MRMKGLKSSRAATLNALYQSLRNVPVGPIVKPDPEAEVDTKIEVGNPGTGQPKPDSGKEEPAIKADSQEKDITADKKEPEGSKEGPRPKETSDDDLYNTLKQLFRVIVNNRKSLGFKSSDDTGVGAGEKRRPKKAKKGRAKKEPKNTEEIEPGTVIKLASKQGKPIDVTVISKDPENEDNYILKKRNNTRFSVSADNLIKAMEKYGRSGSEIKKDLNEAKYIKDDKVRSFLRKNLSFDKLESFDDLLTKVEAARNKIRNAKSKGDDKTFNKLITAFDTNPIMLTNMSGMFDVDSENQAALDSLKGFIDELFITLYSAKVQKDRLGLIDKMSTVGGGNLNALLEAYYGAKDPDDSFIKDAQSRDMFKNNLIKFLEDAIRLFQHLYSKKRNK